MPANKHPRSLEKFDRLPNAYKIPYVAQVPGWESFAAWVRSGYDHAPLPGVFGDAAHAHDWLPVDLHPERFDIEEATAALASRPPNRSS